jgi:hypothetical protein
MAQDRDIREALDRLGADLSAWPDSSLAGDARRLALADRGFRAHLDTARAIDAGLVRVRDALDAEIAASGAVARVEAATLAAVPPRPVNGRRWATVAAAAVAAAVLGAVVDVTLLAPFGGPSFEVVILDPLIFDPAGTMLP